MKKNVMNSQSDNSSPGSFKHLNEVQQVDSPVFQCPLFHTIEIIISDAPDDKKVISSYHTLIPLQDIKIQQLRKQIIEYNRKISSQTSENYIIQHTWKNKYIYFQTRKKVIIYVLSRSIYSSQAAESFMREILKIYEQTILEIFDQKQLPTNISELNRIKLKQMDRKINNFVRQKTNRREKQKRRSLKKAQTFVQHIHKSSQVTYSRYQSLKEIEKQNEQNLKSSQQLRVQAQKLKFCMAFKKYSIFVFMLATLMIGVYLFSNYY